MREIVFRGKRVDNGEWVYGSLIRIDDKGHQAFIFPPYNNASSRTFGQLVASRMIAVIPETVGQYTGLKDKNGKEIYEGDIITTDLARNYLIVEYRNGAFMINCNDGLEDYYDIFFGTSEEPKEVYEYGEIIGNIYYNPELMGEKK